MARRRRRALRGRRSGKPTQEPVATVQQRFQLGKPGIKVEIWTKWRKRHRKLGTLVMSVGGLRWLPRQGKVERRRSWTTVAEWFESGR